MSKTAGRPGEIALDDILSDNRLLRWLLCRLDVDSVRGSVFLAAISIGPFIVLGLAAFYEGRFGLGSMIDSKIVDDTTVLGMSFLGDTMVWPYFFLCR